MKKKWMALLLAAVLAVTLLPGTAWAADEYSPYECEFAYEFRDVSMGGIIPVPTTFEAARTVTATVSVDGQSREVTLVLVKSGSNVTFEEDAMFGLGSSILVGFYGTCCRYLGNGQFESVSSDYPAEVYIGSRSTITEAEFFAGGISDSYVELTSFDAIWRYTSNCIIMPESLYTGTTPDTPASGVTWSINNGVLTVSGTGPMDRYGWINDIYYEQPWSGYLDEIHTVIIGSGVTSIGRQAFYKASNLTSVTIPSSVITIGDSAFEKCSSLTSVTIPDCVTTIENKAFGDCRSLTSVTIPNSVTNIAYYSFGGCSSLTDVYYGGNESEWNQISIFKIGNDPLLNAKIHYNSTGPISFPDVPTGIWYEAAVSWAVEKGYVQGTGNGNFTPDRDCTNIEILTFLWNAEGKPTAAAAPVTVADWAQAPVNWAYEKGIIDNTFQPYDPCTRATTVYYLWLTFGKEEPTGSVSFPDVDKSAAYADAVAWAVGLNIVKGTNNGTYAPDSVCSRSQIATFLHQAYVPEART